MKTPVMTNLQNAFLTLFKDGIDFKKYANEASEKAIDAMEQAREQTKVLLEGLTPEQKDFLNKPIKVLIIGEAWCGDCKNNLPVAVTMAEHFDNWEYRIALRDSHEEIVDQYYTLGGRKKIPFIIIADEDGFEYDRWVERPTNSYLAVAELQAKRLPKEEFITAYKSHPDLKLNHIVNETFNELKQKFERMAAIYSILPKKR